MNLPIDVYEDSITHNPETTRLRLKLAGELWYDKIYKIFKAEGYRCLIHDQCMFIKRDVETGAVTVICIYLDDILFMGNNPSEIEAKIKHFRAQVINLTVMGEGKRYIGVDIKREYNLSISITISKKS